MVSYAILRPGKQICSLPKSNSLWKGLRLSPSETNDEGVCYHGDLMNCNKGMRSYPGGCSWWHFYPDETKEDMLKMYKKIVNGEITFQNTNAKI